MLPPGRLIRMRLTRALAASAIYLALIPMPATASSCAEQIETIERRLDSAGAVQVAGLKAGHILRIGSHRAVSAGSSEAPSDLDMISTAERVASARILIVRASHEDQRGDKRTCEDTMTEAKGQIGALP